ncbi:DUF3300 domain-containing protein [Reyranella sp.]|uniref:DUF3300 domain-containing protein n=1 Tax=Reyranella sp. TaxID=1929291 RepID=UPI003BA8DC9E
MNRRRLLGLSTVVLAMGPAFSLRAQESKKPFTAEQLDQLLAPIALYPDALLSQVLMASTYPLEVVEAARWSQANPNLKGDAAVQAVKDKEWDVSVKSLVAFPQTLAMMNTHLDWTQKVGDAMIGQQKDVADAVQRLRAKAKAQGTLKDTPQQKVTTQSSGSASAIVVEPTNPEVIYVPYYNPTWAYGPWPYPAYPPVYYPPPPNYGAALMTGMMFGLGVAAGAAMFGGWHWGWNGSGWGNSYTTVNVNRATTISANNFNASRYRNGEWTHDPAHRAGVPYRTPAERQRYNQVRPGAQQREQFRGQLDGTNRAQAATNREQAVTNRSQAATNREQSAANREQANRNAVQSRGTQGRSSAFDGIERGGDVNRDYDRGRSSWGDRSFDRGGGGGFRGGGFRR